jgi:hypothetical protein
VLQAFAEGKGDFDMLRGYRWVDKRGKKLEVWPSSESGGGNKTISTACRVPGKLPRGARMQLGILVGAEWETITFDHNVKLKD